MLICTTAAMLKALRRVLATSICVWAVFHVLGADTRLTKLKVVRALASSHVVCTKKELLSQLAERGMVKPGIAFNSSFQTSLRLIRS